MINQRNAKSDQTISAALTQIRDAIKAVVWPPGSDTFTIYPESGKTSGKGNGVKPIKDDFVTRLTEHGWHPQQPFGLKPAPGGSKFGNLDLGKTSDSGAMAVEWETGNISSSHRSMNKMAIGLHHGVLVSGVLIVPTKAFAEYLTDRIGNLYELLSYVGLWHAVPVKKGYLGIFAVEHDETSIDVPRIKKGTDGRALR